MIALTATAETLPQLPNSAPNPAEPLLALTSCLGVPYSNATRNTPRPAEPQGSVVAGPVTVQRQRPTSVCSSHRNYQIGCTQQIDVSNRVFLEFVRPT
jgi:hypothetical protein